MQKIGDITVTATDNGEFTNGNVAAGVSPTLLESGWFNTVQREIITVIEKAEIKLDKNNDGQLAEAIFSIVKVPNDNANTRLEKAKNLSDVEDKTKARENLGLKDSATCDIGTVSGTVAAGDDTRIDGALQSSQNLADLSDVAEARKNLGLTDAMLTAFPVGGVILWVSETLPSGFARLNGAAFDKTLQPILANLFPDGVLPDPRGDFIRCFDNGRGVDFGRSLLSFQDWAIENISGHFGRGYANTGFVIDNPAPGEMSGPFFASKVLNYGNLVGGAHHNNSRPIGFDASRTVKTAAETRPRNTAFIFIIKIETPLTKTTYQKIEVFKYDEKTGEFLGADVEILPPGIGIPAYSCTDAPPKTKPGHVACRKGEKWEIVADHRGTVIYDGETGQPVTVSELGDLPENSTLLAPLTPFDRWDGSAWVTDMQADTKRFVPNL